MKAHLKRLFASGLARAGKVLVRSNQLGVDPFRDVALLLGRSPAEIRCVFDVGANVGTFTLEGRKAFPNSRFYAFEPVRATFEKMRQRLAGDDMVRTFECALGAAPGTETISIFDGHDGVSSLRPDADFTVKRGYVASAHEQISVDTVDNICRASGIDSIDLLKIDVEGYEAEVIKGANSTLSSGKVKSLLLEFTFVTPGKGSNSSLVELTNLLSPFGHEFAACYTEWCDPVKDRFHATHNALFIMPR
jgi:FkbM family methyltransferase